MANVLKQDYIKMIRNTANCIGQIQQRISNLDPNDKNKEKYFELTQIALEYANDEANRIEKYWYLDDKDINDQYRNYSDQRIGNVLATCRNIHNSMYHPTPDINIGYVKEFLNIVGDRASNDLFANFRYGNCNYILFGKNGAGKTTLINRLITIMFKTNSIAIPATRNINYSHGVLYSDNEVNLRNALSSKDGKALFLLSKAIIKKEIEENRIQPKPNPSINQLVENTFNSIGLSRKLIIKSDGELKLTLNDGTGEYSFSSASDGEKSALFFISAVLLAPINSYLIIDEPENHLNGSLMIKLFNSLENIRKDIVFVYATHNLHFIESRSNAEIVYLKKIDEKNRWEFNKFEEYKKMPLDTILAVEGTDDDVIFCEGENYGSLDYRLYSLMYPNYQVVPSEGCEKIMSKTFVFNENKKILRKKAYGIIDNDFRSDEETKRLIEKNIFVSRLNEIENFFIVEPFLSAAKEQFMVKKTVDEIKHDIVDLIKTKKDEILRDYATKTIRSIHLKNQLSDMVDVEKSFDTLNNDNKKTFMSSYKDFESLLNDAIVNYKYEELLTMVPGKKILKDVVFRFFDLAHIEPYIAFCLQKTSEDTTLLNNLRKYVSSDFNLT